MKKILISSLLILGLQNGVIYSQSTTANNNQNIPQTRFLGFNNNFPIKIKTSAITRMHINQNGTNYLGIPTFGYIGIGNNPTDVRSRLTITGTNNSSFNGDGFRSWMKTGVFNLENSDNFYVGLKQEGQNRSDAVLAFGDDNGGRPKNNLRILFTGVGLPNSPHLEIARFTATGNIGFGPIFLNAPPSAPKSLLHMNRDGAKKTWFQLTNLNATGMLATDGFRIGFRAGLNRPGIIRWQENTPLIFQTEWNNNQGGVNGGERLKITNTGYLSTIPGYLGINPNNGNTTRLAISHNGAQPIKRPMSTLHIGYDLNSGFFGNTADGWRDWMDVGTFTSQDSDNMYVGLKNEGNDRKDAVINWGDNQPDIGGDGPDHLRFIFTSTTSSILGNGDSVSRTNDGLEVARFYPGFDTLGTYGRFGVGDFTAAGVDEEPTHKIDVVGNGRFRYLPDTIYRADSASNKVVMVDTNGVLRWLPFTSVSGPGNYCLDTVASPLTGHYAIPLSNYNYYFTGQEQSTSTVGIGVQCGFPTFAKLHVQQQRRNFLGPVSAAGFFLDATTDAVGQGYGILGIAVGNASYNIGGSFLAQNGSTANYGIYASAGTPNSNGPNYAGYFAGDTYSTGTYYGSDQNIKQNIAPITNANDIINQLNPVNFEYKTNQYDYLHLPQGDQMGLIAQEVQQVLPQLVKTTTHPAQYDTLGNQISPQMQFLSLNYEQFIPVLLASTIENNEIIDSLTNSNDSLAQVVTDLNDRLTTLENCLGNLLPLLCQINNSMVEQNGNEAQEQLRSIINVELENGENIVLNQNVPNPFAEQTVITYSIPSTVQEAQIVFYDMKGIIIKTVNIDTRGQGQLNVYGSDLSRGLYTYTLIADGQVIATKKMVKH